MMMMFVHLIGRVLLRSMLLLVVLLMLLLLLLLLPLLHCCQLGVVPLQHLLEGLQVLVEAARRRGLPRVLLLHLLLHLQELAVLLVLLVVLEEVGGQVGAVELLHLLRRESVSVLSVSLR